MVGPLNTSSKAEMAVLQLMQQCQITIQPAVIQTLIALLHAGVSPQSILEMLRDMAATKKATETTAI